MRARRRDDDADSGDRADGVAHGHGRSRDADGVFFVVEGDASGADTLDLLQQYPAIRDGVLGQRNELSGEQPLDLGRRQRRQHRLAVGGAVEGEPRADLRYHAQRATRRVLIDEEDLRAVENGQVDGLAQLVRETFDERRRLVAEIPPAGDGDADEGRTDAQLAGRRRAYKAFLAERADDAMRGRTRQPHDGSQLDERQPVWLGRQPAQHLSRARNDLDALPALCGVVLRHRGLLHPTPCLQPPRARGACNAEWGIHDADMIAGGRRRVKCARRVSFAQGQGVGKGRRTCVTHQHARGVVGDKALEAHMLGCRQRGLTAHGPRDGPPAHVWAVSPPSM